MKKELLKDQIKKSDNARKYAEAIRLFSDDGVEENKERAITLFLETAVNGYVPSMDQMARICHNNLDGMKTQDRAQEYFWFEQMVKDLSGRRLLYHAQNMMEGSYDRAFASLEINQVLELAAALGSDHAKEYMAVFYANKKEDKEALKKSLYWFYSIKERSGRIERELKKVEDLLGI